MSSLSGLTSKSARLTSPRSPDPFASEFKKIQLTESINTYRVALTLLSQVSTTFVLAEATIFGLGITSQRAGLFVIGAVLLLLLIVLRWRSFARALPVMYMAIYIELKYGHEDDDHLVSTYASTVDGEGLVNRLRDIAAMEDQASRLRALRRLAKRPHTTSGDVLIALAALLLCALAFVLSRSYAWPLGFEFVMRQP